MASFASLWLVPRLAQFQRQHPQIDIRLDASDRVVDLRAEDVDLAIRWVPTNKPLAGATLLMDDVFTAAISPRLLQGRQLQRPAELAQWPLLDLDAGVPGANRLNWSTWFDCTLRLARCSRVPGGWSSTSSTRRCRPPSAARAWRWCAHPSCRTAWPAAIW